MTYSASEARIKFEDLCSRALHCSKCPERSITIDIAQPRWVGPYYWSADTRVLALMINPGSGNNRGESEHTKIRQQIEAVRDGSLALSCYLNEQRKDFENWGRGRFVTYFQDKDKLCLDVDSIAFANIAWCATKTNTYPSPMLETCFKEFTRELLSVLEPHIVLLVGSPVRRFAKRIEEFLGEDTTIPTLHYAHREKRDRERDVIKQVRERISVLRLQKH